MSAQRGIFNAVRRRFFMHPAHDTIGVSGFWTVPDVMEEEAFPDSRDDDGWRQRNVPDSEEDREHEE